MNGQDRSPPFNAVILAGSRKGEIDPLAQSEGVAHKALIELEGLPLLARVHAALKAAGADRIMIMADEPGVVKVARSLGAVVMAPQAGPSASVAASFAELGAPLLVTTSDHALLRPRWVRTFIDSVPAGAEVAILMAPRAAVESALPGSKRTWLRFADGDWSGCNLFYLAQDNAARAIASWEQVEADRKRPWRIALRIGLGTIWRYWRGHLTLAEAISRLGQTLGVRAAVVPAIDGLAAVDADKPQDMEDIRALVSERRAGAGL
ncbi:MAG: nucleotidyltransferase family protein [Novosphingobium sp.]|nr:nucleotidyltransferase family protein [Novosphingobium sp.]